MWTHSELLTSLSVCFLFLLLSPTQSEWRRSWRRVVQVDERLTVEGLYLQRRGCVESSTLVVVIPVRESEGSARAGWHTEFTSTHCPQQGNAVSAPEQMTLSVWTFSVCVCLSFLYSISSQSCCCDSSVPSMPLSLGLAWKNILCLAEFLIITFSHFMGHSHLQFWNIFCWNSDTVVHGAWGGVSGLLLHPHCLLGCRVWQVQQSDS